MTLSWDSKKLASVSKELGWDLLWGDQASSQPGDSLMPKC
jgi:hypothetical protein